MLSNIQRYLVPSFLKRLDFWLMTHKPHVWRTRGHFVVFYAAIVALLFFLFGLFYPQTLYDLNHKNLNNHTDIVFAFTAMSFFLVLGGVFWWWFSIQKYAYKRTSVKHFLIEVGIYSAGMFALWTVFWAFYLGFEYNRCFRLEKNKIEDKEWFFNHGFSNFGYMPHYDPNKFADLNQYFANGEKLIAIQYKRASETHDFVLDGNTDFGRNEKPRSDLSSIDWEYKALNSNKIVSPQYKKMSEFLNVLLDNDSLRLIERKKQKIDDNEYFIDRVMPSLDYASIVELTENVYVRHFRRYLDLSSEAYTLLDGQINEWTNQKTFIESLDKNEWAAYNSYLSNLVDYYKDYDTAMVTIRLPQLVAFNNYVGDYERRMNDTLGISGYHASDYGREIVFGNQDKNEIAKERLVKLLPLFDLDTRKKYAFWLSENTEKYSKSNLNSPFLSQLLEKSYANIKANKQDSLALYDYYTLKLQNFDNYRAFFTEVFTDYILKKYAPQDLDRLHQLLMVNGFPETTPQYKDSKLQKIALLIYTKEYNSSISSLENHREDAKKTRTLLWSPFSLLYCILMALVFYVTTLGTGIQFWVALFITGIYWAVFFFIGELSNWRRSYEYSDTGVRTSSGMPFHVFFMIVHCTIFTILILYFLNSKARLKKVHLVMNTVILSGLITVILAIYYWQETIRGWYYSNTNNYTAMSFQESIKIAANVLVISIAVYALAAWLFKRHLTYPKKR